MQIDLALCEEIIKAQDGFWAAVAEICDIYSEREDISHMQARLHNALIIKRSSQEGAAVLQEIVRTVSLSSPAHADIYAAAALGALLPEALRYYQMLGADTAIAHASLGDMSRWIDNYALTHDGAFGINELAWAVHAFAGNIFEIGSLQYQMRTNSFPYYIYLYNGELIALPLQGIAVSQDGHICGTNDKHEAVSFITELDINDATITANELANSSAVITSNKITLMRDKARLVTACGMPVVVVHIPKQADLSADAVDSSISAAKRFFTSLGYPCIVGLCGSWMLDATLKQLMKPNSKILQLSARFTHFPLCTQYSGGRFVFRVDYTPADINKIIPTTSLAKAIHQYLLQGNELFDTGGAILL